MKLLFATDSHLKGRNPSSRIDDFQKAILRKLEELCYVANRIGAKAILHGGDLFDVPDVSNTLIGKVAEIIRSYGIPFYVVPGNHDLFGYNLKSLPQTALGVLAKTGVVTILTRDDGEVIFTDGSVWVGVQGQEYYADIDKGVNNDYEYPMSTVDYKILIPHSMLLKDKFHDNVPHTLTKDVHTNADLILVGHYHPGFADHTIGRTRFINPGSMGRLDATKSSISRIPQYLIINADPTKLEVIFQNFRTAQLGHEVLDNSHLKARSQQQQQLAQFQQSIQNVQQYDEEDIDKILLKLAQEQAVGSNIVVVAQQMIVDAQANDKAATDTSGFIEAKGHVYLKRIELEGFQSHQDTVIDFDNGLNAIVGQSDSGKSAVLRALRWLVYNEPKGTDFIRNTVNSVRVRAELSTGEFIERTRTRKSAGKYTLGLFDDTGTFVTKEYEGFGVHLPPEIASIAQMPKSNLGRGDAETLNFAYQMNAPFLISESGSTRASVIGRLTGVHLVDNAVSNLKTEITRADRELKKLQGEQEKLGIELQKFDHLTEMSHVIDKLDKKMIVLQEGVQKLNRLNRVRVGYQQAAFDVDLLTQQISRYTHMPTAVSRMQKLEDAAKIYAALVTKKQSIAENQQNIVGYRQELTTYSDMPKAQKVLEKLEKGFEVYTSLLAIQKKIVAGKETVSKVQHQLNAIPDTSALNTVLDEYEKASEQLRILQAQQKSIIKCKADVREAGQDRYQNRLEWTEAEEELQQLLASIDICPTCEQPMQNHKHEGVQS